MAKTIKNNINDLREIKANLNIFLSDYLSEHLNINDTADVDELIIAKADRYKRAKKDITNYLYNNNDFKSDFDFSLSHSLKHNNDFTIESDLKTAFDKAYTEKIKAIKEQKRAFKNVMIKYYLSDKVKESIADLIEYTKKRYKMTTYESLEMINTEDVRSGLFEDLQDDLQEFAENNLNYDDLKELFYKEFKEQIKNIKQETPRTKKSQKETSLLDLFLLLKKW